MADKLLCSLMGDAKNRADVTDCYPLASENECCCLSFTCGFCLEYFGLRGHLQVRELYIADLRAAQEAGLAARIPDWPTRRWRLRVVELQDFIAANDRGPMQSGPPKEASLYGWLRSERHAHQIGTLHPAKEEALSQAWPDWARSE